MEHDEIFGLLHITMTRHVEELEKYNRKQDLILEQMLKDQKRMMDQQRQNTEAIEAVRDNTKDIVKFTQDFKAGLRIAAMAQKGAVWFAKWGTIGVGLAAAWGWISRHLPDFFK